MLNHLIFFIAVIQGIQLNRRVPLRRPPSNLNPKLERFDSTYTFYPVKYSLEVKAGKGSNPDQKFS